MLKDTQAEFKYQALHVLSMACTVDYLVCPYGAVGSLQMCVKKSGSLASRIL